MGIPNLFGHQMRVSKRILGHSRKRQWQGEEEAAAVRFVLFPERCDGDEFFNGADRAELYLPRINITLLGYNNQLFNAV
jgi:hypothetical protein